MSDDAQRACPPAPARRRSALRTLRESATQETRLFRQRLGLAAGLGALFLAAGILIPCRHGWPALYLGAAGCLGLCGGWLGDLRGGARLGGLGLLVGLGLGAAATGLAQHCVAGDEEQMLLALFPLWTLAWSATMTCLAWLARPRATAAASAAEPPAGEPPAAEPPAEAEAPLAPEPPAPELRLGREAGVGLLLGGLFFWPAVLAPVSGYALLQKLEPSSVPFSRYLLLLLWSGGLLFLTYLWVGLVHRCLLVRQPCRSAAALERESAAAAHARERIAESAGSRRSRFWRLYDRRGVDRWEFRYRLCLAAGLLLIGLLWTGVFTAREALGLREEELHFWLAGMVLGGLGFWIGVCRGSLGQSLLGLNAGAGLGVLGWRLALAALGHPAPAATAFASAALLALVAGSVVLGGLLGLSGSSARAPAARLGWGLLGGGLTGLALFFIGAMDLFFCRVGIGLFTEELPGALAGRELSLPTQAGIFFLFLLPALLLLAVGALLTYIWTLVPFRFFVAGSRPATEEPPPAAPAELGGAAQERDFWTFPVKPRGKENPLDCR